MGLEGNRAQFTVDRLSNAVAAGTTAVNSAEVDMAGFEGVAFVVVMGTITDGTPKVKAQQDVVTGMAGAADLAGTGVDLAATDDNKIVVLDIKRPLERFLRCVVDRTLGSPVTGAVIDGIFAIRYGAGVLPASHSADVAGNETHVSPAEGTA